MAYSNHLLVVSFFDRDSNSYRPSVDQAVEKVGGFAIKHEQADSAARHIRGDMGGLIAALGENTLGRKAKGEDLRAAVRLWNMAGLFEIPRLVVADTDKYSKRFHVVGQDSFAPRRLSEGFLVNPGDEVIPPEPLEAIEPALSSWLNKYVLAPVVDLYSLRDQAPQPPARSAAEAESRVA